jgi:Na+/H+ antiporter NhaD/arsenite permease-like protein
MAFIVFAVCAATLCGCLESKSRDVRFLLKQASVTLLLFGLGFFLAVAAIDGVGFADTIRYIMQTLIYDRDF